MKRAKVTDPVKLAQELLKALGQPVPPSNDEEPVIDREAIRERARRAADRMRKARNR